MQIKANKIDGNELKTSEMRLDSTICANTNNDVEEAQMKTSEQSEKERNAKHNGGAHPHGPGTNTARERDLKMYLHVTITATTARTNKCVAYKNAISV